MLRFILFFGLFTAHALKGQSFTLKQCIDYAWANHPQVKTLVQGNSITTEQLEQLKAAAQPSLYFNASQNMNTGRSIDPFTYQYTNSNIFSNNFSLNSSVTLFSGFKYKYSKEQTQLLVEANKENIQKVKNDLALSIANQYLQVLLLKEQITAIDTQIALTERQLNRENILMIAGKSNENKILQLKAQQYSEANRLADLNTNLTNALIALKYACSIKGINFSVSDPDISEQLNSFPDFSFEIVFADAQKNMATVRYQKANEKYYEKGIEVSKAGYFPSVTITGSLTSGYSSARKLTTYNPSVSYQPIGYLYSAPTELVYGAVVNSNITQNKYSFGNQVKDNFSQFVGLNLRVPILSNRANRTAAQIARVNFERSQTETENVLLGLSKDVETALNAYASAKIRVERNLTIKELQQTIMQNTNTFYLNGNSSMFELLSQKNAVFQAEANLLLAKYDFVFRKIVIDYYSGKIIEL